jgi:hypothetical protein
VAEVTPGAGGRTRVARARAGLGRWLRESWGFLVLLVPYLGARVASATGRTKVGVWYDTAGYSLRADPGLNHGDLISFTGHAPRLWGLPLFYSLFSSDIDRVRAQWAISTLAFALLAWAFWVHLRNVVVRVAAAGAVLLMSLARQVASWDWAILSEPLTISLGVLAFAGLLLWLRRGSWWSWSVMVTAAFLWIFIRAEIVLAVGVLIGGLALLAIGKRSRGLRRRQAVAAALVLAAGAAWAVAMAPTIDRTFQRWGFTGFVQAEEMFALRAEYRILPDPELRRAYQAMGMPDCPAAMAHLGPGAERRRLFLEAYGRCPELREWGRTNGNRAALEAVVRAPGAFVRQFGADQRELISSNPVRYGASHKVLPIPVEQAFFPPRAGYRILVTFWGGLLLAVALALASGALGRRAALVWSGLGATAVTLGMLVFAEIFSSTELIRYGSQEAIHSKIVTIGLLGAGADALVERFRSRRATAGDAVPQPAGDGASAPVTGDGTAAPAGAGDAREDGELVGGR